MRENCWELSPGYRVGTQRPVVGSGVTHGPRGRAGTPSQHSLQWVPMIRCRAMAAGCWKGGSVRVQRGGQRGGREVLEVEVSVRR